MPDVAMHHFFGQEVKASLPPEIQQFLQDTPYDFALYGPDLWFMYQPWKKRRQGRGRRMHTTRTGAFLMALARRARDGSASAEMFSYLAGFLCHYALDSLTHPYIIWQTTETWPTRRAHRDLEHALDVHLLQREGFWGEIHPITDHHLPALRLPAVMAGDLNAAYEQVYGWEQVFPALNRCHARFRMLYRELERPRSVLTLLTRVFPTDGLRSLPHVRSAFLDRDVENVGHASWHQAYAREETSVASFPELYEAAKQEAVRMITDCYGFLQSGAMSEAELAQSLGNRSYLSGLDTEDPRNLAVPSLQPPEDP